MKGDLDIPRKRAHFRVFGRASVILACSLCANRWVRTGDHADFSSLQWKNSLRTSRMAEPRPEREELIYPGRRMFDDETDASEGGGDDV